MKPPVRFRVLDYDPCVIRDEAVGKNYRLCSKEDATDMAALLLSAVSVNESLKLILHQVSIRASSLKKECEEFKGLAGISCDSQEEPTNG